MKIDLTTRPGVRKAGLPLQLCGFNKEKDSFPAHGPENEGIHPFSEEESELIF